MSYGGLSSLPSFGNNSLCSTFSSQPSTPTHQAPPTSLLSSPPMAVALQLGTSTAASLCGDMRKSNQNQNLLFLPSFDGLRFSLSRVSLGSGPTHDRRFLPAVGCKEYPKLQIGVVRAAWTRRSRGEAAKRPNKKSWGQRTDMYMRPFLLNVFFSKRYVHAKVVHRGTSKVISVASTNAKDLRNTLPSLTDNEACRTIGTLIAERCKEADVFAISYEAKNERIEGKLGIILDTIKENGILFV